MNSVTFFGEVNELHSRAIWWSDSDSEEDNEEEHQKNELNVVINAKSDIICDTLLISLAKSDVTLARKSSQNWEPLESMP